MSASNLFMNNQLLQMVSGEKLIDSIPFKKLFILKRHANIKTHQSEIKPQSTKSSILKTESSVTIHSKFHNVNSLSCIISKPKKSHSFGYRQHKQQGRRRESLLRFQSTQKQSQRYQSRQVQKESRKSIFSLGKKIKIEPASKFRNESGNALFKSSVLNSQRDHNNSEMDSKKFFKSELKSIIREIKEEQHHFFVQGLTSSKDKVGENSALPKFVPEDNSVKPKLKIGFFQNKPYYVLNKRKANKIVDKTKLNQVSLKAKSKGSFIATRTQDKQSDSDLCGWSSRSFYPNNSLLSFKNAHAKMAVCKENVQ